MALREEKLKASAALQALRLRQAATAEASWTPRGERMAENFRLGEFEKFVVLLAAGIASVPSFVSAINGRSYGNDLDVSTVLALFFANSDEEQIRRRVHFYRDAALVRSSLIDLHAGLGSDLGRASIAIDRSVLDFLLGIDVEGQDMVEGSHLYHPSVQLEHVILNEADKQLVVRAVEDFPAFVRERRRSGLDGRVTYGLGLAILLYGPSGTGKTMLANAIATSRRQPVLLANFSRLSANDVRAVFRIARLNRALLFFDECEGIFQSRGLGGDVQALLAEMEMHDGLCILATNRQQDLDEAMYRRIPLKVAFHVPDAAQRKRIFEAHLPPSLAVAGDVDLRRLAWNYELSGGLIKNAVLVAVSIATSRTPSAPVVQHADLEEGCRRQLIGRMQMSEFEGRVIPTVGMGGFVADPETRGALQDVIGLEKSRRTLEQWGLGNGNAQGSGTVVMFHGPPGTGKSRAAEVVAFELGRPIKRVLASSLISKYVGETSKAVVELFASAKAHDAVLVMDEADALLAGRTSVASSTDRYANLDVNTLLQELENYPGVAILTTNLLVNIDPAFRRRMLRVVEFRRPDHTARAALWRLHLPAELPLAQDVDVDALAAAEELSGGQIRSAVRNAAARAALRLSDAERCVTMSDLLAATAAQVQEPGQRVIGFRVG
jgi:SpoVK/Ycf46/Vps4 family AAA+-type ATPase